MHHLFILLRHSLQYCIGRVRHLHHRTRELAYRFVIRRIPKVITLVTAAVCLFVGISLVFDRINLVYVTDSDGDRTVLLTQEENADELVKLSGMQVGEYDEYYYTAYGGNHAVLTVQRAYEVKIIADGKTSTAYLNGGTVQDALEQLDITLGEDDYVEPSLHTNLAQGDTARVYRVSYMDTVETTPIPYETEYRYTSLLYRWPSRTYVLQQGSDGVEESTYRERLVDGVVESRSLVRRITTVEPVVERILAYQAGAPVSRLETPAGYTVTDNVPSSYRYKITNAICTGYSSPTGRGASRLGLYAGTVAVNPYEIPYGSLMYIASADGSFVYGWAIATDTGTALMDGIIDLDLFYDTYLESCLNGKKLLNVYVVS